MIGMPELLVLAVILGLLSIPVVIAGVIAWVVYLRSKKRGESGADGPRE